MKFSLNFRAGALAFTTGFVTLLMQVLIHRMVSAKLLNNYAFLVISLTMLGFAFSGVILSRWLSRFLKSLSEAANLATACFAITTVGATVIFYRVEAGVQMAQTRSEFAVALTSWIPLSLLYAVPFVFCG